ncbi:Plasmodium exported protein (Pm-fam-a like), unknown function, partial [Plasmodium malariae]
LAKYKEYKNYNDVGLKNNRQNKWEHQEKNIYNNKKCGKGKNKQSNRSLLNKEQYYTEFMDYNNGMFDGKHFHFEKKWIKKKDYDNFLEKNRRIRDITLKKIKFRKYRYGFPMLFLFFLLGIGLPILCGFELPEGSFKTIIDELYKKIKAGINSLIDLQDGHIYLILFCIFIVIFSIILIIAIPKILKNNEKYQKIKLMNKGYE